MKVVYSKATLWINYFNYANSYLYEALKPSILFLNSLIVSNDYSPFTAQSSPNIFSLFTHNIFQSQYIYLLLTNYLVRFFPTHCSKLLFLFTFFSWNVIFSSFDGPLTSELSSLVQQWPFSFLVYFCGFTLSEQKK